ncbi:hypothetical protein [Acidianus sp. RZ1]|uniref:hypothetical protein n=1 Tax=Acidianus sp. RZ1 TaxID=1540082 RepID=UPI001492BED9|nr:hypothetical protein [Acidianus sp. RZ1]NON61146.1 hypothetical protein [Acidianus sp. RZ1]
MKYRAEYEVDGTKYSVIFEAENDEDALALAESALSIPCKGKLYRIEAGVIGKVIGTTTGLLIGYLVGDKDLKSSILGSLVGLGVGHVVDSVFSEVLVKEFEVKPMSLESSGNKDFSEEVIRVRHSSRNRLASSYYK